MCAAIAVAHELIEWIRKLEDQGLLGSLLGIKKVTQQADWADSLSLEERRSIERVWLTLLTDVR